MTKEDILAMVPGPELDAAVAEKIFGYWWADGPKYDCDGPREWERILVPPTTTKKQYDYYLFPPRGKISKTYFVNNKFSTDIAAAWEVVERINHHIIEISKREKIRGCVTYRVWVFTRSLEYPDECWDRLVQVEGKTAPEAICKAALLAVMGVM